MAELTTLARPYAKAIFEFAVSNSGLDTLAQELGAASSFSEDPMCQELLSSPVVPAEGVASFFTELLTQASQQVSEATINLVKLLAENKRLALLPEIYALYLEFKAEQEKTLLVTVQSAYPLSNEQQTQLNKALSARLGRSIKIEATIDDSLIGGVVIQAGDLVIDGSVRGKLAKLADAINA